MAIKEKKRSYVVGRVVVFPNVVEGSHLGDNEIVFPIGSSVVCDQRPSSQGPMKGFERKQLVMGELFKTLGQPALVEIDFSSGVLEIGLKPFENKRPPHSLLTLAHFPVNGDGYAQVEYSQALWHQRYQYTTGAEDLVVVTTPRYLMIVHDPVTDPHKPWVVLGTKCSRMSWGELGELQELVS